MENRIGNSIISSGITGGVISSIFCDFAAPFIILTLIIFAWGILSYYAKSLSSEELMIPVIMGISAYTLILLLHGFHI